MMQHIISQLAARYEEEIVLLRNHFHRNPELSFKEEKTAALIEETLRSYGIEKIKRVVGTGIIAVIEGGQAGKTIALRADMDALPIQEDETHEICSQNPGIMHACGHDMHTASLLGTAKILNEIAHELKGRVVLVFQPGEETYPGGAKLILEEGTLNEYKPDWIIGQHTDPELIVGEVGFKSGSYMASADEIYLTVTGQGGHGAFPHKLTDTVLAASQIVLALQQVVSRKRNPAIASVLSFGRFIAEGATNIIPDTVELAGTFRTLDESWRETGKEHIRSVVLHTAKAMGVDCSIDIKGYPSLSNHVELTEKAKEYAQSFLGKKRVKVLGIRMGGEDFSYYSQRYPATFYRFGVKPEGEESIPNLHTSGFFGDSKALRTSMATMSYIASSFLQTEEV